VAGARVGSRARSPSASPSRRYAFNRSLLVRLSARDDVVRALELFKTHPIVGDLHWFRGPRAGSSVERTIAMLCSKRDVSLDAKGELVGLMSNAELAERLGVTEHTIRHHIEVDAALDIQGLLLHPPRSRILMCVQHTEWLAGLK
jgi:hypothetical protein